MISKSIKLIVFITIGFLTTNCSNHLEDTSDTIAPTILIESPEVNQNYVGYW